MGSGIRPPYPPGPRGVAPGADRRPSGQFALGPPGCVGVLAAHAGPCRRRNGLDLATHDALAAAERAGVIEIQAGEVRFTHPLLASTVYAGASPPERRVAHRALADRATDPEERARHLALASEAPDASIAEALDDAARLARARGAPDSAAELAALARELTPPADVAVDRSPRRRDRRASLRRR